MAEPFIEEFSNYDEDGVQVAAQLNAKGQEVPDPVPMKPPIGYTTPDTLEDMIRRLVRGESMRQAAEQNGMETWEEADDFDLPDDPTDPQSPWEMNFDQAAAPRAEAYIDPRAPKPPPAEKPSVEAPQGPQRASSEQNAPLKAATDTST